MSEQRFLSHEEVWDDSALIDSWNQALDEYKKYHSIHAKGGSVKDLEPKDRAGTIPKPDEEHGHIADQLVGSDPEKGETAAEISSQDPVTSKTNNTEVPSPAQNGISPGFPIQTVLGSVKDENLKKLLMSWYYAGYYTGLYEGQQQAHQDRQS